MALTQVDGEPAGLRRRELKRFTIAALTLPLVATLFASLAMVWNPIEPGAASEGWRIGAAVAVPVAIWVLSGLTILAPRIPRLYVTPTGTRAQFVGGIALSSAVNFLLFVGFGSSIKSVVTELLPVMAVTTTAVSYVARRRAAKHRSADATSS